MNKQLETQQSGANVTNVNSPDMSSNSLKYNSTNLY